MKPKIKRILVPLDGSENSIKGLDKAIYLARQCSATITGLYVVPFYVVKSGPRIFGPYREKMLEQVRKSLTEAKIRSAKNGIVFDEKIIEGDVIAADIANFAKNKKFDLIVIASRGFGPVKEVFLGSVAYGVLHKSKIPVLLVK
ncbi:MAG: universal stress protein [Nitrosotalea sp.]